MRKVIRLGLSMIVFVTLATLTPVAQNAEATRLRNLSSPEAVTRARAAYELSRQDSISDAAVTALARLVGDDAVVDRAAYRNRGWQGDMPWTVGREAAATLAERGRERAVPPLISALTSVSLHGRRNAAWALGAIDDARAVDPLIAALGDVVEDVQQQAAWALGAIGDRRAAEPLGLALPALGDKARDQAAWALGAIGDARAASALRAATGDPDLDVASQARWALTVIDGKK